MSMGTRRQRQRQEPLWITHTDLARAPGHPFYKRLNQLLDEGKFDEFAEKECAKFYAENNGRPSLTPGIYFRLLLVGYFEGIDSERGIAWRAADSLGLRQFLGIGWDERTPDHSTISRTRRLIDLETHRKVFFWVLGRLQDRGLVKGKTVGIDATTLEANAAMRSIVRRDNGESYEEFLKGLAKEPGIEMQRAEVRTYIPEKKQRGRRDWEGKQEQQRAVYANRQRVNRAYGQRLLRKRGALIERSFAHGYDTGGMRRTHLRGHPNILKRQLIHIGAFNLSLIFRSLLGAGTPRELRNRLSSFIFALSWLLKRSPMCTGSINLYSSPPRLHPSRMSRYLRYHFRHSKRRGSATDC